MAMERSSPASARDERAIPTQTGTGHRSEERPFRWVPLGVYIKKTFGVAKDFHGKVSEIAREPAL